MRSTTSVPSHVNTHDASITNAKFTNKMTIPQFNTHPPIIQEQGSVYWNTKTQELYISNGKSWILNCNASNTNLSQPIIPTTPVPNVKQIPIQPNRRVVEVVQEKKPSDQIILGTNKTTTINAIPPSNNRVLTINDSGKNANILISEGSRLINGASNFSETINISKTKDQIILGSTTINVVSSNNKTLNVADCKKDANILISEGSQVINGINTFTESINLSKPEDQLILGKTIINSKCTKNLKYTLNDVENDANFIMSEGSQLINGQKTFNNALITTSTSNQIVVGDKNTTTLNIVNSNKNRIYNVPDVGASSNFVMSNGDQIIKGVKTMADVLSINNVTKASLPFPVAGGIIFVSDEGSGVPAYGNGGNWLRFDNNMIIMPATEINSWCDGVSVGNLENTTDMLKISGITKTQKPHNTDFLWAISGGQSSKILAINKNDATSAGKFNYTASPLPLEIEDITSYNVGIDNYVVIGDIGDKNNSRQSFFIFRIREPFVTGSDDTILEENFEQIECKYEGTLPENKDAGCLMSDPNTGDLYIITRVDNPPKLYKLEYANKYEGIQKFVYQGTTFNIPNSTTQLTNGSVVGGDISFSGERIIIKNYWDIYHFERNTTQSITEVLTETTPIIIPYVGGGTGNLYANSCAPNQEVQGKSITFDSRNDTYWTASEYIPSQGNLQTISIKGSINGTTLTVNTNTSGLIFPKSSISGTAMITGTGISPNTYIVDTLETNTGLIGKWKVNNSQNVKLSSLAINYVRFPLFKYDPFISATDIITEIFQDGVSPSENYNGTTTTWIQESGPASVHGNESTLIVDYNTPTDLRRGLIKFDLSIIPKSAIIVSSQLDVYIDTEGQGWSMHKILSKNWLASSTWTSTGGIRPNGVEASSTPDVISCININKSTDYVRSNVSTSTIQGWVTIPSTNNGWLCMPHDILTGEGVQIASKNAITLEQRPKLSIRYYVPY